MATPGLRIALALGVVLPATGCAFVALRTTAGGTVYAPQSLTEKVSFDHGCEAKKLRLIRTIRPSVVQSTWDIDVCGAVRRYECVEARNGVICSDSTNAYPASALPAPGSVPAPLSTEVPAFPGAPVAPATCQTTYDCIEGGICLEGRCRR